MAEKTDAPTKLVASDSREKYHHAVLTDAQVDEAKAKARKTAEAARTKSAMKHIEEQEAQRLLEEEGVTTLGGVLDEIVTIHLDLAPDMAYIALNGKRFYHNRSYTVSRAVANDLMYIQYKGQENEARRLGQSKFEFYQRQRAPLITPKGTIAGGGVNLKEALGG